MHVYEQEPPGTSQVLYGIHCGILPVVPPAAISAYSSSMRPLSTLTTSGSVAARSLCSEKATTAISHECTCSSGRLVLSNYLGLPVGSLLMSKSTIGGSAGSKFSHGTT